MEERRINSFQTNLFRTNVAADLAALKALLAPTVAGVAALGKYQEGDIIRDAFTGMSLSVIGPLGVGVPRQVMGENCTVRRMTAGVAQTILANHYVSISSNLTVSSATANGQMTGGIALNDAAAGEAVYVLTMGPGLVVRSAAAAPTIGGLVTTNASGESRAAAVGEFATGITTSIGVVIDAIAYDLVTFAVPSKVT